MAVLKEAGQHPFRMLLSRRLAAQQLSRHAFRKPADLVGWLGAMQAQDYLAARWALALRLAGSPTQAAIEEALSSGEVLRVHALRRTWQLVAPADLRWLLAACAPRAVQTAQHRYQQLGLTAQLLDRGNATIERAVRDRGPLTRAELAVELRRAKVPTEGQRLPHLLEHAELHGLVCSGPRRGNEVTYAPLDARVPASARAPAREDAVAELARRYFRSRGPATLKDFTWWSGLTAGEARAGLEGVEPELSREVEGGVTYFVHRDAPPRAKDDGAQLLPAFDEYLVAYARRDAHFDAKHLRRVNAGGGMLKPCLAVDGRVVGTWRRTLGREHVTVELLEFERTTARERSRIDEAAERYAAFLGLTPKLVRRRWTAEAARR